MIKKLILPVAAVAMLSACNDAGTSQQGGQKGDILKANLDSTVNPADDFFEYANGAWLKANPIPASESSWGIAQLVNEELYERKRKISEDAAKKGGSGVDKLIGDFWNTAMDSAKIDKDGIAPLKADLDQIDKAATPADIMLQAAKRSIAAMVCVWYDRRRRSAAAVPGKSISAYPQKERCD